MPLRRCILITDRRRDKQRRQLVCETAKRRLITQTLDVVREIVTQCPGPGRVHHWTVDKLDSASTIKLSVKRGKMSKVK